MLKLNPELIIEYLNSLIKLDKDAIGRLIELRTPCNNNLAKHETVQVLDEGTNNNPKYSVGLLGILNGLCGIDDDGYGFIMAEIDGDNNLIKFIHKKDRNK